MKTNNITPLQRHAFKWSEMKGEKQHLINLAENGSLNDEQLDYVNEYILVTEERLENFEWSLFDYDEDGSYHENVLNASDMLIVEPSQDFLSHLQSQLDTMSLSGINFDIKKL